MRKQNWISLLLIIASVAALLGYRTLVHLRTDTEPPAITVEDNLLELSVLDSREALLQGVSARDRADGDVTASLAVENIRLLRNDGTVTVTYAAFDNSGNVAKQTREVRFTDYRSPRFSLSRPLMFAQTVNYDVLSLIDAKDMLDGDISHRIRATVLDEVPDGYAGTHHVQFRVTNSLGETVELILPVEIYTPTLFEGSMTLTDYLIYLKQGEKFDPKAYLAEFSLARENISLKGTLPEGMSLKHTGTVKTGMPGVYTVDYEVSYDFAGQVYTAYSRLIVVVEE